MRLHASCVALGGRGILIIGAAGSGKSALALELMAHGAALVADDQVLVDEEGGVPVARCPAHISGAIEARGVGLLAAKPLTAAPVALVIDMDRTETERLPPDRGYALPGGEVALLHKLERPYFAAAILQYMTGGKARL